MIILFNSMDFSTDLLIKIKELASKLTPITEISALLDLNEIELRDAVNTPGNPVRTAYFKGFSERALKIRERNLELAEAGSPSADDALFSYLKRMMNDL